MNRVIILALIASTCTGVESARVADSTSGSCSPIISENKASVTIQCSGISPQYSGQIVDALNRMLQSQIDPKLFVQKLDEVIASLQTLDKNNQNIAGSLKQETSKDPRKELANNNLPWTADSLEHVANQRNMDLVDLFFAGGMPADVRDDVGEFVIVNVANENSHNIQEVVRRFVAHGLDLSTLVGRTMRRSPEGLDTVMATHQFPGLPWRQISVGEILLRTVLTSGSASDARALLAMNVSGGNLRTEISSKLPAAQARLEATRRRPAPAVSCEDYEVYWSCTHFQQVAKPVACAGGKSDDPSLQCLLQTINVCRNSSNSGVVASEARAEQIVAPHLCSTRESNWGRIFRNPDIEAEQAQSVQGMETILSVLQQSN
jgi:hypothetical protein